MNTMDDTKIDIKEISSAAPEGHFSDLDIEFFVPYVVAIPANGCYLEVGVFKGRSLWIAQNVCKSTIRCIGVDEVNLIEADKFDDKTIFVNMSSRDAAAMWKPEQKIDVLFLDGDHSYEGVKDDLKLWAKHVKEGGTILFHDYDKTSPGVIKAADEFAKKNKLKLEPSPSEACSMAVIQL